ncbi:MAG: dienelactone hydrolase family protein [candidate division NC10 bacterium]
MGFSKGGFAALYSSLRRFARMHGPAGLTFAAHVAFYPICQRRFIDEEDVTDRPIRVFHGEADDWTPIEFCRKYVERLRRAGKDATLVAYPGAHHGFDSHLAPPGPPSATTRTRTARPWATSRRSCVRLCACSGDRRQAGPTSAPCSPGSVQRLTVRGAPV